MEDINIFREKRFDAEWFIKFVWRPGDRLISTRLDKLRFLCHGSPKLRILLHHIYMHILNGSREKLLVCEATTLSAYFWEIAVRFIFVKTRVMHSGLDPVQRTELITQFNDPNDALKVLIIMYDVSAQGLNLHHACGRAVVMTSARNAAIELQAWGRILRVSQAPNMFECTHH